MSKLSEFLNRKIEIPSLTWTKLFCIVVCIIALLCCVCDTYWELSAKRFGGDCDTRWIAVIQDEMPGVGGKME